MSKHAKKVLTMQSGGPGPIPGMRLNEDKSSLAFVSEELPASKHYFYANYFDFIKDAGQLYLIFGEVSPFRKNNIMDRAVQIALPIETAVNFLLELIWNKPSRTGSGRPFSSTLESIANSYNGNTEIKTQNEKLEVPSTENLRTFAANVVLASFAQGQSGLEFLEASPNMVANLTNGHSTRPDDSVSSVISIILDPLLMWQLLSKLKPELESMKEALEERMKRLGKK